MPPLDTEEEDTPDRGGGGAKWVTLLCVILAIALLVSSLPSGISSSTSVNAKIYSDTMQQNTISTVLSGGGTLTPQEGEALSIPQALEVKARYVSNGDHVQAGDPIAQVDKAAVLSAISELQEEELCRRPGPVLCLQRGQDQFLQCPCRKLRAYQKNLRPSGHPGFRHHV